MNYPFTKKKTLAGVVSLALVLTSLSGCSLLPSSQGNETIPTEEETVPPTIAVTLPPTEAPTQAPTINYMSLLRVQLIMGPVLRD